MPYVTEITGHREGQPIYREIPYCDWCGNLASNIQTEGSKTIIGCIRTKDGQVGCKENSK